MNQVLRGLRDALSSTGIKTIQGNPKLSKKIRKALFLNFLFLAVLVVLDYVVSPLLEWLLNGNSIAVSLLQIGYYTALLYPIYIICLLLNSRWYAKIAEEALTERAYQIAQDKLSPSQLKRSQPRISRANAGGLSQLTNELYRLILGIVYIIQLALCAKLPFIGTICLWIGTCWLCSLYSFEYVWSLLGLTQHERLTYFSERYLYMLGFGLPLAVNAALSPGLVREIVFAVGFPFFIINSIWAKPVKIDSGRFPARFNPFGLSQVFISPLLKRGIGELYYSAVFILTKLSNVIKLLIKKI
jgi:etoposide-induced 2.4 mRNA